jgi:hypothetical protein
MIFLKIGNQNFPKHIWINIWVFLEHFGRFSETFLVTLPDTKGTADVGGAACFILTDISFGFFGICG